MVAVRQASPSELLGFLLPGRLTHGIGWIWFSRNQSKEQKGLTAVRDTIDHVLCY